MSATTKKFGILEVFKSMFSSGVDIEDYEEVTLPKELEAAKKSIEARESKVKQGFNSANKGGFAKKIDPKTEEAMRAMHSKVVKREQKSSDIERGE